MRRGPRTSLKCTWEPLLSALIFYQVCSLLSSADNAYAQRARLHTEETLREILSESSYQSELPKMSSPESTRSRSPELEEEVEEELQEPPANEGRLDHGDSSPSISYSPPPLAFEGITTLIWGGLGVIALLVIIGLFKGRGGRRVTIDDEEELIELEGERAPINLTAQRAAIQDAEALAAEGRYEEAVHKLLLQTVTALRAIMTISEDLTAREIYQRTELDGPPKTALYELLSAAELAHFGERPMGRETFVRCLAEYKLLLAHLGAGS